MNNKIRLVGLRMDGIMEQLEPLLIEHIKDKKEYMYLEIGVAHCYTFRSITDIIKENIKVNEWLTMGLDLANSLDVNFKMIDQIFSKEELLISRKPGEVNLSSNDHSVLVLRDNPREWINTINNDVLDLVFIDANHSLENSKNDFLAIEDKVKSGALVMFHDSGLEEVGTDCQGGNEYINVYGALKELGLLDNSRKGWELIKNIDGTRKLNNDPNGSNSMSIFRKIS